MSEKERAMRQLQEYGFALTEVNLFLDSHPDDAQALAYYQRHKDLSDAATQAYEENYGPITINGVRSNTFWDWVSTPWPWECEG